MRTRRALGLALRDFYGNSWRLVAVNAATRQELLRLPSNGRIVMTEGARGAAVGRWLKALARSP